MNKKYIKAVILSSALLVITSGQAQVSTDDSAFLFGQTQVDAVAIDAGEMQETQGQFFGMMMGMMSSMMQPMMQMAQPMMQMVQPMMPPMMSNMMSGMMQQMGGMMGMPQPAAAPASSGYPAPSGGYYRYLR